MLELWLIRHGLAPSSDEFNGPDADRPLSDEGAEKFTEFAEWVAEQTTIPYVILSSPFVRARQTAEILAEAGGLPDSAVSTNDVLKQGADQTALIRVIREQTAPRVAMVLHEPDLSQLLSALIGGGDFLWAKGGIAIIAFEESPTAGNGFLFAFIRRKLIVKF